MPKETKELAVLQKRIAQLKKHFNFKQSINGISNLQADRLRGLIVLCHAEFEDYFESIAVSLVKIAEDKWDRSKISNYNLSSLFISSDKIMLNTTCLSKSKQIICQYKSMIKTNHGIKEEKYKKCSLH